MRGSCDPCRSIITVGGAVITAHGPQPSPDSKSQSSHSPFAPPLPACLPSPRTLKLLRASSSACTLKTIPGKGHAMMGQWEVEVRHCMEFWAGTLSRRAPIEGCVEVRPGSCSVQQDL